ncbi:hypothetical protein SISNIDRAFT_420979 [Sistotremastrum niveocremeum HHB9708]|uniref:Uncharacterized protein n=1 Tax=Sistotremastrum niveocremeum HHB9708 TaxID=1314777 RepID=A0A164M5F4_9AGAM|nr:hypothetical protein SISNIDRAFT_420979 [Sistotremastrum niveocremeum HHB9708]
MFSRPVLCLLVLPTFEISESLDISTDGGPINLHLCGIIYHGGHHFTARIRDQQGLFWSYDGIVNGRECIYEGTIPANLSVLDGRAACVVIFA